MPADVLPLILQMLTAGKYRFVAFEAAKSFRGEAAIFMPSWGVELAGRFVVGVKPDGTLIVGDKPVETAPLFPADEPTSKWEDRPAALDEL